MKRDHRVAEQEILEKFCNGSLPFPYAPARRALQCATILAAGARCRGYALQSDIHCVNHSAKPQAIKARVNRMINGVLTRRENSAETRRLKDGLIRADDVDKIVGKLWGGLVRGDLRPEQTQTLIQVLNTFRQIRRDREREL